MQIRRPDHAISEIVREALEVCQDSNNVHGSFPYREKRKDPETATKFLAAARALIELHTLGIGDSRRPAETPERTALLTKQVTDYYDGISVQKYTRRWWDCCYARNCTGGGSFPISHVYYFVLDFE